MEITVTGADIARMAQQVGRIGSQGRFGLALALTHTALDARDKIRQEMPGKFELKSQRMVGGVLAQKATKQNLQASVYVHRKLGFLALQEYGGTKTTPSGTLAVPRERSVLGQGSSGKVPPSRWPRNLLKDYPGGGIARANSESGKQAAALGWQKPFTKHRKGRGKAKAFLLEGKNGTVLVRRKARKGREVETLYHFHKSARVAPRWGFTDTATDVFKQRFLPNLERAVQRILEGG